MIEYQHLIKLSLLWGCCAVFSVHGGAQFGLTISQPIVVKSVVNVYDGNRFSVYLSSRNKKEVVKIRGVDTPSIHGQCEIEKIKAIKVIEFVRLTLKQSNNILLDDIEIDKYKHILATVYVDGDNLSGMLIKKALARRWQGQHENWCH